MKEAPLFTVEDHLRVQQQIEARTNELWRAGGCFEGVALSDWLRAEREVLEKFVLDYHLRQSAGRESSRNPTAEVKAPRPKAPILRQSPTIKSQKRLRRADRRNRCPGRKF